MEKKETKPVQQIKMPAKPHTPVNIFMSYAKEKVKNSEKGKDMSSQVSRLLQCAVGPYWLIGS